MLANEAGNGRSERLLLVGADPDKEPLVALYAGTKCSTNTCAGTDTNSAVEHGGSVPNAGKLKLSCPQGFRRVRDKTFCEIALDAANHVVVARPFAFTDDTKCMVLHNRGSADSAEQALLHSAMESNHCDLGRRNFDIDWYFADGNPRDQDKDSHAESKPEFLGTNKSVTICAPSPRLDVVGVSEDNKDPSSSEPKPSDEAVVPFEDVVVGISDPREGANNGYNYEDAGNNARHDDGIVLDLVMSNNIHDLEDKPCGS